MGDLFSSSTQEEHDLFADVNVKTDNFNNRRSNMQQHQRVSSVPNSPEQTTYRWNKRMVNSIASLPSNLSEIPLKSNDVSPSISTATTTQSSAFGFISKPANKKSPRTNERISSFPFENSILLEKPRSNLNETIFQLSSEDMLSFSVPNNGQQEPAFQTQNLSNSLNFMKSRRIASKTNKVSLEELDINMESNTNIKGEANNNMGNTELELSRMEVELQQILNIQSNVFQRKNSIYEQLAENFESVKSLEINQTSALSSEDYAKADKLTNEIQEIHHKINNLRGVLPGLDQTLNELREKQVDYLKSKADIRRILEKELKKKKNEHIEACKLYDVDIENLRNVETKKIISEREEIEKAKSEIVFDEDLWSKSEVEFNERIEDHCRNEKSERETLSKKRENIRAEIKELMLRIERLRADENGYSKQISDIDLKIESITSEYSSEREGLLREKNELDNRKRELENKSGHVEEMDNQLHNRLDNYQKQRELSQKELTLLEKRIGEMGSMSKIHREEAIEIEKLIKHLRGRAQRDLDCEKEISEIRAQMEEYDVEVKRLTSKVMHDKQTYSNVQQDISTIDTQIPALEEQKKLAVVAARLATRIKDLQSTRDERTKFLKTKCSSLEQDQEDLKMARKKLEEYHSKLIEVEKNTGSDMFEELNESLLQHRSRYDVASQRNHHILVSLLRNEIKGLESCINQIKARYGLSNSKIQSNQLENFQEVIVKSKDFSESINIIGNDSTRLEELEAKLQEAVNREDYTLAEQLQNEINSLTS
ncbi:11742_t:CDS:10 [Funneliformis geosporum]|uniref:11742_t:CDS:1 n=1 Tax=Funneliformis geosporum TaxID=1117311 RepID=A0A9W4SGP7_9GLOM|nr:11742_t:CDS:10 [Funneliformis geosporum]